MPGAGRSSWKYLSVLVGGLVGEKGRGSWVEDWGWGGGRRGGEWCDRSSQMPQERRIAALKSSYRGPST